MTIFSIFPEICHVCLTLAIAVQIFLVLGQSLNLLTQETPGMRRQQAVRRYQVLIDPGITQLVGAEAVIRPLYSPDTYLRAQGFVDLGHDVRVLDDKLERDEVSCSMHSLIRPRTADQGRFLGIVGIGFGDGASSNEGAKEVALYSLFLIVPIPISAS